MTKRAYTVDWLRPDDAAAIAAVEAQVHSPEHRAGARLIWAQLQETEQDGRNISLGLYYGTRLVGFGLGFVMRSRREMADFFDAPLPAQLDPEQSTIYVSDYVVLPKHRQASRLISAAFSRFARVRDDLCNLPIDGFSTAEYAEKWRERSRFIAKLGWQAAGRFPFHDKKLGVTLNWLCFERIPQPRHTALTIEAALRSPRMFDAEHGALTIGQLSSLAAWEALRPHWNALLDATDTPSPLHTWEYLRTWHAYFGLVAEPLIIVALKNSQPVAVVPLQIQPKAFLGQLLGRASLPTETYRPRPYPTFIGNRFAKTALYEYLATNDQDWASLVLCTPSLDTELIARLRRKSLLVIARAGPLCHRIDLQSTSWAAFLSSRPAAMQEAFAAGGKLFDDPVRFEWLQVADDPKTLEEFFVQEQHAPDDETGLGTSVTGQQIAFYRELANRYAAELGMFSARLLAGDQVMASLLGYLWRRQLHVIHVTRSAQHAPELTAILALGHLIEHCFSRQLCQFISLPDLSYAATAAWATHSAPATVVCAERNGLAGKLRHALNRIRNVRRAANEPGSFSSHTPSGRHP